MTALVIADDELVANELPEASADLLVSCGDLPDDVILRAAARCGCRHILAVKGNHDSGAPFPPPILDLHLRTVRFHGLVFGGFCGAWKYKPVGHHLFDEAQVETNLASFPAVDVFVAHNSPRLVHDRDDEVHVGFAAFTNYVTRTRPRFFLHGHQHQHQQDLLGSTWVIGTYGHRFVVVPD
jgi:Icc-related predicted phosphoesterase